MPTPQETAYPTLKTQISKKTLERIYSPSASEVAFVENYSRTPQNRACMLALLKCAQRLGHFVFLSRDPPVHPKTHRRMHWVSLHSENAEQLG